MITLLYTRFSPGSGPKECGLLVWYRLWIRYASSIATSYPVGWVRCSYSEGNNGVTVKWNKVRCMAGAWRNYLGWCEREYNMKLQDYSDRIHSPQAPRIYRHKIAHLRKRVSVAFISLGKWIATILWSSSPGSRAQRWGSEPNARLSGRIRYRSYPRLHKLLAIIYKNVPRIPAGWNKREIKKDKPSAKNGRSGKWNAPTPPTARPVAMHARAQGEASLLNKSHNYTSELGEGELITGFDRNYYVKCSEFEPTRNNKNQ